MALKPDSLRRGILALLTLMVAIVIVVMFQHQSGTLTHLAQQQIALVQQTEHMQTALNDRLTRQQAQLARLERTLKQVTQKTPVSVSAELPAEARKTLHTLSQQAQEQQQALSHLRSELDNLRKAPVIPSPTVAKKTTRLSRPPFILLAINLRGGQNSAVVAPVSYQNASQLVELRPGEAHAGWRLEKIQGQRALFRRHGQQQVLKVSP
ncbi:hypothetical protein FNN89_02405 [Salmonella enterica subsp. salamae]|nr:hypothetical protein [Salmonella enterica]ECJ5866666.1 hypothetical protein [Salmonella enterica subsp. salamae]EIY6649501.1 hypothetical protein [Salmonella enterica]